MASEETSASDAGAEGPQSRQATDGPCAGSPPFFVGSRAGGFVITGMVRFV